MGRRRRSLPSLPRCYETPVGPVRVVMVDYIEPDAGDQIAYGAWSFQSREIRILRGMAREAEWYVLLHERCHQLLDDAGIRLKARAEEAVCDAYAQAHVAQLRTNLRTI